MSANALRVVMLAAIVAPIFHGLPMLLGAPAEPTPDKAVAALEKPARIDWVEMSLKGAMADLKEKHGVPFNLQPGVEKGTEVITYKSPAATTLGEALTAVLAPLKLSFEARNGAIVVVPISEKK